jgi:hypothetical protein
VSNNDLIVFKGRKPMAKLDTAERDDLPSSEFAEPKERKYPINDKNHAKNALGRAKQMLNRGTISQAQYDKIAAKADNKLGKKPAAPKKEATPSGDEESRD